MRGRKQQAEVLLRVDHEAALAKLARSQLQGTWQLPAELARLAIFCGARSLAFNIASSRLELVARGARLGRRLLADFATVLDGDVEVAERHQALVALEEHDAFALAALAGIPADLLRLSIGEGDGLRLERIGTEVRVSGTSAEPSDASDFFLTLEGLRLDAERASRGLERLGRFSPVPLSVGGLALPRGFEAPLIKTRLGARPHPTRGRSADGADPLLLPTNLAIPRHGRTPRLWLLRHGIVATRATVPGFPSFEAAVEMAAVAPPGPQSTGAALREAIGPYLEDLVDAGIRLNLRLVKDAGAMPEKIRARTACRLLEAARKKRRVSEVAGAQIFPLLTPGAGRRLVSMDEISRLVRVERGGTCALDAIAPHQDAAEFVLPERGVLVLSDGERALLGEQLKVVFSAPPARLRRPMFRRLVEGAVERLSSLPVAGGVLADEELSAPEREFLEQVRGALAASVGAPRTVAFRRRGGRVRRSAEALLLPLNHPTVRAAVRAVGRDAGWLYPFLMFLLAGRGRPDPSLRRRWLEALPPPDGEPAG